MQEQADNLRITGKRYMTEEPYFHFSSRSGPPGYRGT